MTVWWPEDEAEWQRNNRKEGAEMSKPTVDALISFVHARALNDEDNAEEYVAILATLQQHKQIMEAERPEPVAYASFADNGNIRLWSADKKIVSTYEAIHGPLQPLYGPEALAYADRMQAERDALQDELSGISNEQACCEYGAYLVSEKVKAERQLAECRKLVSNALDQVGHPDYSLAEMVRDIRAAIDAAQSGKEG